MSNTAHNVTRRSLTLGGWTLLAAVLLVGACSATRQEQSNLSNPRHIISPYVFGARFDLSTIPAEKLTHINYAFAHINDQGEVYFRNPAQAAHLAQLQALKARNPNLKLLISIGGAGADGFSDAALTEAGREKFSLSAIKMVKDYALDGIDLDWEFPGHPGRNIKFRPEDKQNFTLMLQNLRGHLDRLSDERGRTGDDRYQLAIASTDGWFFDKTEMDKAHVYLDHINIMSYDIYGEGPTNTGQMTGHHTGLHLSDVPGTPPRTTASFVQDHLNAGIPAHKLVVGSGFYGEAWTDVPTAYNGRNQNGARYIRTRPYRVLVENYINKRGFMRYWDEAAQAPYLWNPDSTTFISYDDPESLRAKAEFVKENGLGGMMWWEQGGDYNYELLTAVYEAFN